MLTFSTRYAKGQLQVWNGQKFASIKQLKNALRNFRCVGPLVSATVVRKKQLKETPAFENATAIEILDFVVQSSKRKVSN